MTYCHVSKQIDDYCNNIEDDVSEQDVKKQVQMTMGYHPEALVTLDVVNEEITNDTDFLINYFYETQECSNLASVMLKAKQLAIAEEMVRGEL